MSTCLTCGGLAMEPGKAYGYVGKVCHCIVPPRYQRLADEWRHPQEHMHNLPNPCNCIGPQNGQPLCPCQMRGVTIKDGRYVRIQDIGPAPK